MSDLRTTARAFFSRLNKDNTKVWWQAHKPQYDTTLKAPALALLDTLAPQLSDLTSHAVTPKLFRPHRDVRFSKDKTPYNTHLHMMWALQTDAPQSPVYFFGIGLDYVTAGAGIMGFDKPVLENWRKFVDLDTDRILAITDDLIARGYVFREPALKRVPPAYDKDHIAAHLLRMKGVVASCDIADAADIEEELMAAFESLWPLNALLLQVAEA